MGKIFESTPAWQKGLIGEDIVKKHLESLEYLVRRPDDTAKSGASNVDFVVEQIIDSDKLGNYSISWFVEVKVKSPIEYSYRFPVYMFPKTQIDSYKRYADKKDSWVEIYIVDEQRESIFGCPLTNDCLEYPLKIEDKTFPLDVEQSNGHGMFRVYSIEQFHEVAKIDFTDLERLRSIKFSAVEKKCFKPLEYSIEGISDEELVLESREFVMKYLGLNLPSDLPSKDKKILSLVKSLRPKLNQIPTCFFYEIYHAVHNININNSIQAFVNAFYPLLDEIKHNRQKNSNEPDGKVIKNSAEKISELVFHNDIRIEIFKISDIEPYFFVEMRKIAMASGYEVKNEVPTNSSFGNSVRATSKVYSLNVSKYIFVPVKNVSLIVNEYAFNRVDDISKYKEAIEFLEWWKDASEPYIDVQQEEETPTINKSSFSAEHVKEIGKIADSIVELTGSTRQDAIRVAVKIKSSELNIDLTPIIELLK